MDDDLHFIIYESIWANVNIEIKSYIREKYLIDKYGDNDEEHIDYIYILEYTKDIESLKKIIIETNPSLDEVVIITIKDIPEYFNSLIPKNIKIKDKFNLVFIYSFD